MPVIVVGADTALGEKIVEALLANASEVRAFVTNVDVAMAFKARGAKVAIGDVSDGSHVGGAALNAFCAVLISEAATDDRERSFAATPDAVVAAWAEGLADAGTKRAIWIDDGTTPTDAIEEVVPEFALVRLGDEAAMIDRVIELEGAAAVS